ncbi:pleckstrin homology domain-containing family J member 1 isoform X1 [Scomber scombrus]|uniref:pleckstrin homology domain-containing family J member 1 isoform X1 n=1 Tax=Scomber scombrus TaxID=13677 RepID=UPI002DDB9839|nr:pleckstrin homology domain-containing family J member 1 isoform X1 [Scomber scombrus]
MRFNEKELVCLSRQPSEMAAELGMRGPKKGDVVKKRLVKLVVNFLFYFRTDEEEPIGALLLEQCRVEREDSQTFSIAFLDEAERKYLFECDSEQQCGEWIDCIIKARILWSSMVYQTKLASKSAMVCSRSREIPPLCRPESCIQMFFIFILVHSAIPTCTPHWFENKGITTASVLDDHCSECIWCCSGLTERFL